MPGTHTIASPSRLERLAKCPGMARLTRNLPESPSTQAADDGTRRHALLEHANRTGVLPPMEDPEDRRLVSLAWPYFRDHPARTQGLWLPEKRVEISASLDGLPADLCYGTVDVVAAHKDTLEIIDAKFGRWPVDPLTMQLKAYAYGALRLLLNERGEFLRQDYRQIKWVKLTIVQPQDRVIVKSTEPMPLVETLEVWRKELLDVLTAVVDPDAPLQAGEWCRWCAAKDTCPEFTRSSMDAVRQMFGPVEESDTFETQETLVDVVEQIIEKHMSEDPCELSEDALGRILDFAPQVKQFLDNCEKVAQERLEAGSPVAGWKLVKGRGSREWNQDEDAVVKALKGMQLKAGEIYTKKLVTPAQAEKLPQIAGSPVRRKKLGDLIHKKEGKPQLAPEDDPRPGVDALHSQMFEPVEEETQPALPDWL